MPIGLSIPGFSTKKRFDELTEQEILALAISSEEEDGGIYGAYANKLRNSYPASAAVFDDMAAEENEHRRRLIDLYQNSLVISSFLCAGKTYPDSMPEAPYG